MIVLDLDGVLANFVGATCELFDRDEREVKTWDYFKEWGITASQFWGRIHGTGDHFYGQRVKPYPWYEELIARVRQADSDWLIMTAPSCSPYSYSGKKIWVDKWLQPILRNHRLNLVVGSAKELLANEDTLLIDDYDKNISKFRVAGGHACMFPQPWNHLGEYSNLVGYSGHVEYVLSRWENRNEW